MKPKHIVTFAALLALQACAPALSPEGARVQAVSKEFADGCERLGIVEGTAVFRAPPGESAGPTSINNARGMVAARGGDAMLVYVMDRLMAYGRGSRYVTRVEALKCGK